MVVASHTRLPFVEKYRPKSLEELVSHTEIINTITKMADEKQIPHFLLYGPPGTGKTTTILAMARRIFGNKQYASHVIELNASDDRGIDVVRNSIIQFADSSVMNLYGTTAEEDNFKLVILDEADAMTKDAQNALKRVIEKYSKNVRFCLICNHLSGIIPAVQSRCTRFVFARFGDYAPRFRFPPLSKDQIMPRLMYVANEEKIKLTEDGKQALFDLSGGDMRRILNVLQSTSMAFDVVNEKNVYACVGQPSPVLVDRIVKILLNDQIRDAVSSVSNILTDNSVSLVDVIDAMFDRILALQFEDQNIPAALFERLSIIQKRVKNGCSESTQLNALIAAFFYARESMFIAA